MSVFSTPPRRASPSQLHSASVHITGFADFVNPSPWNFDLPSTSRPREKDRDGMSHEYLSPKKLTELTGEEELSKVSYLEVSLNTLENSLGNFGIIIYTLQRVA